ncbi:uncharacterized protein E0L32_011443 [Thyridium curvatum]|uniref:Xylanolytic transcriptional activator regulatory domain-containing protein n=1 Tax=Thyridium curvatum TaxID=1093900 RepID=A0A507BNN7_9PEZI|nr:uncharacterized protein E0L32_011443 [Thyridium curvatum]TPX18891.1 hypothetical protein E0L32_011443 [Thyridium curvatum]
MDISDLLVRHEKLVHLNENNKDGSRPRKTSTVNVQTGPPPDSRTDGQMLGIQPHRAAPPHYNADPMMTPAPSSLSSDAQLSQRTAPACNLDLLSDAATHLASAGGVHSIAPLMSDVAQASGGLGRVKYDEGMQYGDRGRENEPAAMPGQFPAQPATASFDDYHLFLDEFASSPHFLPPPLDSDPSSGLWPKQGVDMQGRGGALKGMSSFPSTRFSSLQPDMRNPAESMQDDAMRAPMWRISAGDHTVIKNRLDEFSPVLPADFVFPSRHTLTRFLEGYITGFHEHLPFLHIPTLSPAELSPELLLAILAVGAQYRFESHRAHALWYAAKAVALEQIRRRHSHEVHGLLPTQAAYSPHSTRPSPSNTYRHSFSSVHQERPITQDTHREPFSPNTPQSRLETIQALLLLFAVGLWGAKAILHEALSLQSQLALLIREEGLTTEAAPPVDWESWIRLEGSKRTKLIAFCFFNLCSIAYNTPPMLLTSEIYLHLPHPSRLWRAESSWQWQEARQACPALDISLQDGFSRYLNRPSQGPLEHMSCLGNYVLIHAFIQHIYLLKQTSFATASPFDTHRGLKMDDVEDVTQALRVWQVGFEQHRQQHGSGGGDAHGAGGAGGAGGGDGPVAFNSTALLRLAYIRLYTDLSPSRTLESRDYVLIANGFQEAPLLVRSQRLTRAIWQAIHALSLLVKVGVNYVARTKSLEWSMQHTQGFDHTNQSPRDPVCNLECAILLSKWLMTLAAVTVADPAVSPEEKTLLEMVRRMLDETEFAVPIDPSLASSPGGGGTTTAGNSSSSSDPEKLRQLAGAVVRLWAETFKGTHIFEMVRVMSVGLEGYADLLTKQDRAPGGLVVVGGGGSGGGGGVGAAGRLGSGSSLG